MKIERAYAILQVKAASDGPERIIEGVATTPTADRTGDVVVPDGAEFKLPLPFLLQHDQKSPIGHIIKAKVTKDGIDIVASIANIEEEGPLKSRIDEAWQMIKSGLITGLSIGFKPLKSEVIKRKERDDDEDDSFRFFPPMRHLKWLWLELSAVTIPANAEATITAIKAIDTAQLAALGIKAEPRKPPGAAGIPLREPSKMKTLAEQISALEATRAAKSARMQEVTQKAIDEARSMEDSEREEFDTLKAEIDHIDADLVRFNHLLKQMAASAKGVDGSSSDGAQASRGEPVRAVSPRIEVKRNLPKGTAFTRYAMLLASAKGNIGEALAIFQNRKEWQDTPEVELVLKAAVAAGTTTDATWAGPLAPQIPIATDFLELLRPATIIGRIPNLRRVPFNVSVPTQTAGGVYGWVGEGVAKPLTKADFSTVTLRFAKAAGIIVLTEELVRMSTPSAEELIRAEMIAGIGAFLDVQFIDPTIAEVTNVSPASITNGTTPIASSGATGDNARTDIKALINSFVTANLSTANAVFLMSEATAFALQVALNPLGQPLFPGVTSTGGTLMGIPVVTSNSVGNRIILVDAQGILYADEGGVSLDISREASVQMDSAPDNPTSTATILVSFWQRNLVGLRAERFIVWKRARLASVKYVSGVAYT